MSEANVNGEWHGAQGYVENQGEDLGNGNTHDEQYGVQGHGKDQADLVFEYEDRVIGIRISTNKPTI